MTLLSNTDREKLDNYNGMAVGAIFRKTREDKGYELLQVSSHLNIGRDHLTAIENDDYDHLPQKVYAVGFVRAYADLLELDSEKMAYLFKVQAYGKKDTETQKQIIKTEGKTLGLGDMISTNKGLIPVILAFIIFAVLIISAIVFLGIWLMTPSEPQNQMRIPEVPLELLEGASMPDDSFVNTQGVEETAEPIEPFDIVIRPNDGATTYGVDASQSALTFKMVNDGWLEIRTIENGQLLISETLNAGDVFYVAEDQDVLLTTNNAVNIEAYLDGQKLGLLGNDGDIIRLRPFSVKALRLQRGE